MISTHGLIFDIKRYSINDGPGIRTTIFFKGCPLRCAWCHNPEGQSFLPELILRPQRCLEDCTDCIAACPTAALHKINGLPVLDRSCCTATCTACSAVCPTQSLEVAGRRLDPPALLAEIEKEQIFYDQSGGGVTFSGGEPLSQLDFLTALLSLCRSRGIHTAVDTCGFVPPKAFAWVEKAVDLFLFDLKLMDNAKHKKYTGQSNSLILENLERLTANHQNIVVRIPLISGVNDDDNNICRTAEFLRSLRPPGVTRISLLPYHRLGRDKLGGLGRVLSHSPVDFEFSAPAPQRLQKIKNDLASSGFSVAIGE